MEEIKKSGRYQRIFKQLEALLMKTEDPVARMATACAVLHHKMTYYFWTGFYLLKDDKLIVGPYQGPVACLELEKNKGVCWATIRSEMPLIVKNVHDFPGHIACDSRSKSEITVPLFNQIGKIEGVFDVDSDQLNSFSNADRDELQRIMELIYR